MVGRTFRSRQGHPQGRRLPHCARPRGNRLLVGQVLGYYRVRQSAGLSTRQPPWRPSTTSFYIPVGHPDHFAFRTVFNTVNATMITTARQPSATTGHMSIVARGCRRRRTGRRVRMVGENGDIFKLLELALRRPPVGRLPFARPVGLGPSLRHRLGLNSGTVPRERPELKND